VVLAFRHALRAHEALSRSDALSGLLEVIHRLFEDGVFVSHDRSTRISSVLRSVDYFALSREYTDWKLLRKRERMKGLYPHAAKLIALSAWCPSLPKRS
jgi:hypothetical protein